jgi:predicted nuclease with TOPRIM domain
VLSLEGQVQRLRGEVSRLRKRIAELEGKDERSGEQS